ncbi:MAG: chemotaxis protein CheW [Lysobacterales bacterium CG17_big_fil_post_rev_8_21_14_2_50_64_11]|nr:MAG: chemotaxis protein CheW [Xanthomonadales bacterium CG17_big_fil_post_rev_8_21_14_2_50_64_11]PIX59352.1 MAG: chemotaxis protein CheW [Xanthomonadales bacterium CG_4_10_14_3_um_filter_64_11]
MNRQTPAAGQVDNDLRGVLITIAGGRLLLPNASMAEIISFSDPEVVANAPAWLLGRLRWRGWRVPVIAFARLAGIAEERSQLGSKVVVIKALGGNQRLSFFAVLTQGFPRLINVSRDRLVISEGDGAVPLGVKARVLLNDDAALIPDLTMIELLIDEALHPVEMPAA